LISADFVPFPAHFDPFSPLWYDGVVLFTNFIVLLTSVTTDLEFDRTDSVQKYNKYDIRVRHYK
jgi:hypothetical protein